MSKKLLIFLMLIGASIDVTYAALITTVTKNDSFSLMNPRDMIATDIQIGLIPPTGGQLIGAGSDGGSAFDRTILEPEFFVSFYVGSGTDAGTGVAGLATITLNIQGFDVGTNFSADFSYDVPGSRNKEYQEATLLAQGIFDSNFPQGPLGEDLLVKSVPEPSTLFVFFTGLLGLTLRTRGNETRSWRYD